METLQIRIVYPFKGDRVSLIHPLGIKGQLLKGMKPLVILFGAEVTQFQICRGVR